MGIFRNLQRSLLVLLALLVVVVSGCNLPQVKTETEQESVASDLQLQVHVLDVGQADAFLIQLPNGQNMMIDAGKNGDGAKVVNYLKDQGVSRVDYLIGTHPDEDHIGGLDEVIKNFTIGKLYMPNKSKTTVTYTDVISAAKAKGLTITPAKANTEIVSSTVNDMSLQATLVAPVAPSYSITNDYSGVIRLSYGTASILFTGDAEQASEADMLNSGQTLSANILKVGHHGSRTSTSDAFLKKVNPSIAVISNGKGNSYGHPHAETIKKLKAQGIKIFRTDQQGTIIFTSTGKDWSANQSPWWQ
ncbi:hypothetical protein CIG75_04595 [Tumebacillus algifaecis]|uniref:Metallo-beta-lactamase domain-containing protein n=1 Tax=Tumebacillus algifaecis TaxID=1214604 RepID=A0A223CYD1_9BACL|nr:ComEC/Rec2 family competence protein [Tumebacillus algifaecis]ASS74331.1 hypothetical protein CIG75_04595 [Tumebacillus algifaecis]